VGSGVIKIHSISRNLFIDNNIKEEKFWGIIHAGFAHKRKVLIGNLKDVYKKNNWLEILEKVGLTKNTRAEDVRLEEWIRLLSLVK
jgi:16S rRNA (adenine1518-N6/adenine1519-N6)-dimethyltransferase